MRLASLNRSSILLDPKLDSKVLTANIYPSIKGKLCRQSVNIKTPPTESKLLNSGEMCLVMIRLTTNRTWLFQKRRRPCLNAFYTTWLESQKRLNVVELPSTVLSGNFFSSCSTQFTPFGKIKPAASVHCGCVVPHHKVTHLPLMRVDILALGCMLHEI